MKNKKDERTVDNTDLFELPSSNKDMEKFIVENQPMLFDKIIDNIDFAIKNKWSVVEVFSFTKSKFIVVINKKDFKESLQLCFDFGMENQHYNLCAKSKKVMDKMDKMDFVRHYKINPLKDNVKTEKIAKKSPKRPGSK